MPGCDAETVRQLSVDSLDPCVLLAWQRHPARQAPRRTAALVAGVALLASFAGLTTGLPGLGLLAALLLLGSVPDYLWPSRFRLTAAAAERASLFGTRRLAWERVQVAYELADGVLLSPLPRRCWLDAFRGLFVPFDGRREEILDLVDRLATERRRPTGGGDGRD